MNFTFTFTVRNGGREFLSTVCSYALYATSVHRYQGQEFIQESSLPYSISFLVCDFLAGCVLKGTAVTAAAGGLAVLGAPHDCGVTEKIKRI
jgi:hypothetical protein